MEVKITFLAAKHKEKAIWAENELNP